MACVFGMPYSPQLSLMRYLFGVVFLNIHYMLKKKMDFKLNLLFPHKFVLYLHGLIWTIFFHSFPLLTKRDQHESTFLVIKNFSRQNYGYCYPISYIHFLNASSLKVTHLKMMWLQWKNMGLVRAICVGM